MPTNYKGFNDWELARYERKYREQRDPTIILGEGWTHRVSGEFEDNGDRLRVVTFRNRHGVTAIGVIFRNGELEGAYPQWEELKPHREFFAKLATAYVHA